MTEQIYLFIALGYLVALAALVGVLVFAQMKGYWRWQDVVEASGWPRIAAQLFTLAIPLIFSIIVLFT